MNDLSLYSGLLALLSIAVILWLVQKLMASENEKQSMQNMMISLMAKYSNRDNILAKYTFDTNLGVYKHTLENRYYCHRCLVEETKESPLESQKNGLFCPTCGSFYKTHSA